MNVFKEKEIFGIKTLGDKLRQARLEEEMSLEEAVRKTKIRKEYLQYLEEGQYEKLPGEVYIRNFLISYAKILKVNPEQVINLFKQEKKIYQKVVPLERHPQNLGKVVNTHPFLNPHFIRNGLLVLAILILLFYLGLEINKIIAPPILVIDNPSQENLAIFNHTIEISGKTEKEAKILINGQEILGDQNGHFQTVVNLEDGINVIKISAVKKHSKESVVYKRIEVESNNP